MSGAADAEMARAEIIRYKDYPEQLVDDRANKTRQAEARISSLLDSVGDRIVGIHSRR